MFSAVKNFILTFVIALIVFGVVAWMVVGLVLNNLNGTIGNDTNAETTKPDPVITDSSGEIIGIQYNDSGDSFNVLIVGTDFRPSEFIDYDPDMLERLYGITPDEKPDPKAPEGLTSSPRRSVGIVSDGSEIHQDGQLTEDGQLIFDGGFYSYKYRQIEADTIVLLRVDKERGHYSYSAFPTDALIEISGRYVPLSEVYGRYGLQFLMDSVHAITGISVDKYAVLSMEGFPAVIDALGGVDYYVPCNMNYDDYSGNVHIHLDAGRMRLDGNQSLQLLMYNGYDDGVTTRQITTENFIKAMISSLTSITNYTSAGTIFAKVDGMIETDFTAADFAQNIDMIFKCAENTAQIGISTKTVTVGEKTLTVIDTENTLKSFSQYRKIIN